MLNPVIVDWTHCVAQPFQGGALLKEKCRLNLQVERNLEGDISHAVPDFIIQGGLSSVHCSIDLEQYKLLRGMLEHNFGEQLEEFQRPLMSPLQDPKIQVRNSPGYGENTPGHTCLLTKNPPGHLLNILGLLQKLININE